MKLSILRTTLILLYLPIAVCMTGIDIQAQEMWLKDGMRLQYKVKEMNEAETLDIIITKAKPEVMVEWTKSNRSADKGNWAIQLEA